MDFDPLFLIVIFLVLVDIHLADDISYRNLKVKSCHGHVGSSQLFASLTSQFEDAQGAEVPT